MQTQTLHCKFLQLTLNSISSKKTKQSSKSWTVFRDIYSLLHCYVITYLVSYFCIRMPFLSPTSDVDIHWTSSFLQPSTDSWRKGRRSILRLLSDVSTQTLKCSKKTSTLLVVKVKVNADLYSASSWEPHLYGAQVWITVLHANTTHLPLPR